jgi:hypothetical protein
MVAEGGLTAEIKMAIRVVVPGAVARMVAKVAGEAARTMVDQAAVTDEADRTMADRAVEDEAVRMMVPTAVTVAGVAVRMMTKAVVVVGTAAAPIVVVAGPRLFRSLAAL